MISSCNLESSRKVSDVGSFPAAIVCCVIFPNDNFCILNQWLRKIPELRLPNHTLAS